MRHEDIDPTSIVLCNRHRRPMVPVVLGLRSELVGFWHQDYWRCDAPGCTRYFTPNLGYVNIAEDGHIENGFTMLKLCGHLTSTDSMHTSMAIRSYNENTPHWQCVAPDCESRFVGYPQRSPCVYT